MFLVSYFPVLVAIGAAVIISGGIVILSAFLGPRRPSAVKMSTYECGIPPLASARIKIPIKFYLVALLFLLFDMETVFILAWAVAFRSAENASWFKGFILIEMAVFIAILMVGYVYAWRKGALKWN